MPSVEENIALWEASYDWTGRGEEWSVPWGGSAVQWRETLLPRIRHLLPARTILEIAPGYGRWTQYLREQCEELVLVDVSERCIRACQKRFGADSNIEYFVNNGRSLDVVPNGSVDFAFSFDSLVHVERDVLCAYLQDLGRKLTPTGSGFIHHSNAGQYVTYFRLVERLPPRLRWTLYRARIVDNQQLRALSTTASQFRECCDDAGLHCTAQELVAWDTRRLIDCFSTITRFPGAARQPTRIMENRAFMDEAARARRLSESSRRSTPSGQTLAAPID